MQDYCKCRITVNSIKAVTNQKKQDSSKLKPKDRGLETEIVS